MVKILCVNDGNLILPKDGTLLTKGNFYDAIEFIGDSMVVVVDDTDKPNAYSVSRFKLIDEIRDDKINQLIQ